MVSATDAPAAEPVSAVEKKAEAAKPKPGAQLSALLLLLERAVKVKDTKLLVGRLLRQTAAVRKQLTPEILTAFLEDALPAGHPTRIYLLAQLSKVRSNETNHGVEERKLSWIDITDTLGVVARWAVCPIEPVLSSAIPNF